MALSWDNYEGFDYSLVNVYRYTDQNGWDAAIPLSSNLNSYTFPNEQGTGLDYVVEVSPPATCVSSKANDYNTTRSNRITVTAIQDTTGGVGNLYDLNTSEIAIYPNPFYNSIYIKGLKNQHFKLFNDQGKIVKYGVLKNGIINDLVDLQNGAYIIEVSYQGSKKRTKLVKR